ncbi:MAG: GNAT family N-acetyltransferase [Ruthenibacterium sp.]
MLVHDIAAFWQYHASLVSRDEAALLAQAEHTLSEWPGDGYALFSILFCGKQAGFLHMQRTGPIVMQLEDIFVQPALRGQGLATSAIEQAEEICRRTPGIEAVTLQAVTRNEAALRLYYKLGYDTLPLVTLHKNSGQIRAAAGCGSAAFRSDFDKNSGKNFLHMQKWASGLYRAGRPFVLQRKMLRRWFRGLPFQILLTRRGKP